MKIAHLGTGSDKLKKLPTPSSFLDTPSKRYYKKVGAILIKIEILKEIHLPSLEMFATNYAQWEFAVKAINEKNKEEMGKGYIQTFTTGATNITTELSLKRNAEKAMNESIAAFGLDPISEKKLQHEVNPNQGDLFEGFKKHIASKM